MCATKQHKHTTPTGSGIKRNSSIVTKNKTNKKITKIQRKQVRKCINEKCYLLVELLDNSPHPQTKKSITTNKLLAKFSRKPIQTKIEESNRSENK